MDTDERKTKRVCFLSEDAEAVEEVSGRLTTKGVEVLGFSNVGALTEGMESASKSVLVVDTRVLPRGQDIAFLLSQLELVLDERPVWVCMAHSKDIELRLRALRAGAEAFFPSTIDPGGLAARLLELAGGPGSSCYRVLVVDDEPVAAVFAARVLESAGMQARIVEDALQVLKVLEEFRPDLVLMDLHMPGADGIELTTLIREHEELHATPVVFLSSELDTGKQMHALRVGGDDFIAKPVRPERLVESVRRGIRSYRSTKQRRVPGCESDWITGLMSRSAFLKRLDALVARGSDAGPGLGVLIIGVDSPERRIDAGQVDLPIERLAGVLREHLSPSEVAARCGDTRFVVLAMRENEAALGDLARALRPALSSVSAAGAFRVGIGIGLFQPRADDALTMLSRAEKALFRAQEADGTGIGICRPLFADGSDAQRDARLIEIVEEALASEGFHLMHQPIVALRGLPRERYETTLRLRTRDGEYVPAFDFLPAAQRRGFMPAIDRWVMEQALDELRQQRNAHPRLRFFVHQTMCTLSSDDWLSWFRDQIVERDLIKQRPVLQFHLQDLHANRESAISLFGDLHKLSIKTCLNLSENDEEGLDVIEELGISLVRLPLRIVDSVEAGHLKGFVGRLHELGSKVIVARIEQPQSIARVWSCGADFIQGNFLQLPSQELSFDFSESALT
jgi:DNA-binding response OmpR family regulator/EAL domain-containing protein (putative c-di-GMP-specific phosphodiesterase class I)